MVTDYYSVTTKPGQTRQERKLEVYREMYGVKEKPMNTITLNEINLITGAYDANTTEAEWNSLLEVLNLLPLTSGVNDLPLFSGDQLNQVKPR